MGSMGSDRLRGISRELQLRTLNVSMGRALRRDSISVADPIGSKPPPYRAALTTIAPELRLAIYDYLLVVEDVFVRWKDRAARYDVRFHDIFDRDIEDRMYRWRPLTDISNGQQTRGDGGRATKENRARGVWFWDNRWELHKPQTQLFLVCKLVYEEAMYYYLTKNTFHIMGTDCGLPYLS